MTTLGMFSKLIVSDEEALAAYYGAVYGLNVLARVDGDSAGTGERFREVIMGPGTDMSEGTIVMFNFIDREKPRDQQLIAGFMVDDLDALVERITANGGKLVGPVRDQPDHGVRVVFSEDPEGILAENVQLIAHR